MNIASSLVLIVGLSCAASDKSKDLEEAIAALREGNNIEAVRLFAPIAEAGDVKAQVTLGSLYLEGKGLPPDYESAMRWYVRAFEKGDGDAYNNIGVMYRDGKGVPENRELAYALFLMVHMERRGTEATQIRAGSNLAKEQITLGRSGVQSALCRPHKWVLTYVISVGRSLELPTLSSPSNDNPRLKDMNWWMPGELPEIHCPK